MSEPEFPKQSGWSGSDGRRILLVLPNWIGDAAMAWPVVWALVRSLPGWRFVIAAPAAVNSLYRVVLPAVLGRPGGAWTASAGTCEGSGADASAAAGAAAGGAAGGDLRGAPSACVSGNFVDVGSSAGRGPLERLRGALEVRGGGVPEAAFLFPTSPGAALFALAAGAGVRVGRARSGGGVFLTHSLPHPEDFRSRHRLRYWFELLPLFVEVVAGRGEGFSCARGMAGEVERSLVMGPGRWLSLPAVVRESAAAWGAAWRSALDAPGSGAAEDAAAQRLRAWRSRRCAGAPLLAVAMGGRSGEAKRWPPGRHARLAAALHRAGRIGGVVVVGAAEDSASAAEFRAALAAAAAPPPPVLDLCGATSLPELCSLFASGAFLALSANDSGPMHLAALCGVPTLTAFGSTSPAFTAPLSPDSRWISSSLDCSPCFARRCPRGATADDASAVPPCMEELRPEALLSLLSEAPPAGFS